MPLSSTFILLNVCNSFFCGHAFRPVCSHLAFLATFELANLCKLQAGCEVGKSFFRVENCDAQAGGGFRPPDGVSLFIASAGS